MVVQDDRELQLAMPEVPTSTIARLLIAVGVVTLIVGLALLLWPRIPMLGRLPGDITIQRDGFRLFIPAATSIVISVVLTIVVNVVLRLFR
jgi:hypothetical protein